MTIFAKSRKELYVSVALFIIGYFIGNTLRDWPESPMQLLLIAGFRFVALFCVLNALADNRRMYSVERCAAILWYVVLLYYSCAIIWQCVHYAPFVGKYK